MVLHFLNFQSISRVGGLGEPLERSMQESIWVELYFILLFAAVAVVVFAATKKKHYEYDFKTFFHKLTSFSSSSTAFFSFFLFLPSIPEVFSFSGAQIPM